MTGISKKIEALLMLLRIQGCNWEVSTRWEFRFILCGIFSFLGFYLLGNIGKIVQGKETEFLELFFLSPGWEILVLLVIFLGYLGLYCSIIATALFTSLLPKNSR